MKFGGYDDNKSMRQYLEGGRGSLMWAGLITSQTEKNSYRWTIELRALKFESIYYDVSEDSHKKNETYRPLDGAVMDQNVFFAYNFHM